MGLPSCVSFLLWVTILDSLLPNIWKQLLHTLFSLKIVYSAMTGPVSALWHGWKQKKFVGCLNKKMDVEFYQGPCRQLWGRSYLIHPVIYALLKVHPQTSTLRIYLHESKFIRKVNFFGLIQHPVSYLHLFPSLGFWSTLPWLSKAEPENIALLILVFSHHRLALRCPPTLL